MVFWYHGSERWHLYHLFFPSRKSGHPLIRLIPESDLDIHLEPEQWFQAFCRNYKGIMNISLVEAIIKVFTRWYDVPTRLTMMFPNVSPYATVGATM